MNPEGPHTLASPSTNLRMAVFSHWQKYVQEVLVNRLGGLSLPRKSVVRLTDRPDMTSAVYRGRKTTQQLLLSVTVIAYFLCSFNPFALRTAKTPQSFGCSECSRVKCKKGFP